MPREARALVLLFPVLLHAVLPFCLAVNLSWGCAFASGLMWGWRCVYSLGHASAGLLQEANTVCLTGVYNEPADDCLDVWGCLSFSVRKGRTKASKTCLKVVSILQEFSHSSRKFSQIARKCMKSLCKLHCFLCVLHSKPHSLCIFEQTA